MKRQYFIYCLIFLLPLRNDIIYCDLKFIYVTVLYNENNPERLAEYIQCFLRNLHNPYIKKYHVFYDRSRNVENQNYLLQFLRIKNVEITYIDQRPSFSYIFDFINNQYPQEKIILSNADIYFNRTLGKLESANFFNTVFALTRWDVKEDNMLVPHVKEDGRPKYFSQDTWIFETPIRNIENTSILFGTQHCDGKLNFYLDKIGIKLLNPCLSIQCCHLHLSNIRSWKPQRVPTDMKKIPWSFLEVSKN